MGRKHILLLDQDLVSLKVSDTNLRRHGYLVFTASSGREALRRMRYARPDAIICDIQLRDQSGFDFRSSLLSEAGLADVPFMFTAERASTEAKVKALQLGVEIFLVKPLYTSELLSRIQLVLSQRESEALEKTTGRTLRGLLSERSLADLISMAHKHQHSCTITLFREDGEARLYFHRGDLVDAEYGHLVGKRAVFRMLTWRDGKYEIRFKLTVREPTIQGDTDALLLEGLNRADEWHAVMEQLPSLDQHFEMSFNELRKSLTDLPAELNPLIKLLDGRLSLAQVVDQSPFDDLDALTILSRLYFEGFLAPAEARQAQSMDNIRYWLGFSGRELRQRETPESWPAVEPAAEQPAPIPLTPAVQPADDRAGRLAEQAVEIAAESATIEGAAAADNGSSEARLSSDAAVPSELDDTIAEPLAPPPTKPGPPPIPKPRQPAPPAAETQVVIPGMRLNAEPDHVAPSSATPASADRPQRPRSAAQGDEGSHSLGEALLLGELAEHPVTQAVTPPRVFAPVVTDTVAPQQIQTRTPASIAPAEEFVRTDNYDRSELDVDQTELEPEATDPPADKKTLDFTPQPAALEQLAARGSQSGDSTAVPKHRLSRALDTAIETMGEAPRAAKVIPFNKSASHSGAAAQAVVAEPAESPKEEVIPAVEEKTEPAHHAEHSFFYDDSFRHDSFSDLSEPQRRFRLTKGMAIAMVLASVLVGVMAYVIYRSTRPTVRKDPLDEELPPRSSVSKRAPGVPPKRPLAPDKPLPKSPIAATMTPPGRKTTPGNPMGVTSPKSGVKPTPTLVAKTTPKPVAKTTPPVAKTTPTPKSEVTTPTVNAKTAPKPVAETTPTPKTEVTSPTPKTPAPRPDSGAQAARLYQQGLKAHRLGVKQKSRAKLQRAATLYRKVLKLDRAHSKARLALSQVYLELKQSKAATKTLKRVTQSNPKNAIAFLSLGATYQQKGNKRAAIAAYRKYLKLAPTGKYAREVRKIVQRLQRN